MKSARSPYRKRFSIAHRLDEFRERFNDPYATPQGQPISSTSFSTVTSFPSMKNEHGSSTAVSRSEPNASRGSMPAYSMEFVGGTMLNAVVTGSSVSVRLGVGVAECSTLNSVSFDVKSTADDAPRGDVNTSTDKLATSIPTIDNTMTCGSFTRTLSHFMLASTASLASFARRNSAASRVRLYSNDRHRIRRVTIIKRAARNQSRTIVNDIISTEFVADTHSPATVQREAHETMAAIRADDPKCVRTPLRIAMGDHSAEVARETGKHSNTIRSAVNRGRKKVMRKHRNAKRWAQRSASCAEVPVE